MAHAAMRWVRSPGTEAAFVGVAGRLSGNGGPLLFGGGLAAGGRFFMLDKEAVGVV
jgi:hypothetical protein